MINYFQDGAVFLINNLHQLRSTLSLYPGTEQRLAELADTLNSRLVGLSKEQVSPIFLKEQVSCISQGFLYQNCYFTFRLPTCLHL